ncbi:MAG: 3-hydroxybutyryl-CoA dehydrogenase [Chloroflexota bacterium]|nr:MAG: 3-hydroxybutyryl-CoA dehydrogenase [Chloroflexota bacterium]
MEIRKVGVVGCGLMGGGIAQVAAQSGYDVVVREINEQLLNAGLDRIKGNLRRNVQKGQMSESEMEQVLGRLHGTVSLESFADRDIVLEAVIENMPEKRQLYGELDKICPPHTIFASNTSSLTIIEMAAATKRQDRFVGLHFFNPVPTMQLAEVVKTISSSESTVETVKRFAESLNKTAIVAKDTPGFIVNRLLVPYLLDAIRVYEEGLATREDIDDGMRLGCNHPMGPLTLADFVGLDTLYFIGNIMFDEFKEPRFAPPTLLKRLVLAGQYGRKTGKGFYEYSSK